MSTQSQVSGKIGFKVEDTSIQNASGADIIKRIQDVRQSLNDTFSKITQSNTEQMVDMCFTFSDERFINIAYNPTRNIWSAMFYDKNSILIIKAKTYASGYVSLSYPKKYVRKSSKFEGKIFEHIIKFVDTGQMP